ncbi:PRC-barrel domain-containing protein [uncultured Nitrospira sp.]|uniref:PRC-barrel domain-containing protein n=1 Tax=uncultured Nitrospira sp. TaxID=157176 RepID=UPI0031409DBB
MNTQRRKSGMVGLALAFALTGGGISLALSESEGSAHPSNDLLLNANTLIGNTVVDNAGKELGTVKDLLIDQKTGQISYIVLSYGGTFGGTLGIGAENYSIPWAEVKLTKQDNKMLVQVAEAPIGEKTTAKKHPSVHNQQAAGIMTGDFNPATVETVDGTVEHVNNDLFESEVATTDSLIVLDVKTSSGTERVRVAPDNYLKEQGVEVKEGDTVEVTGSRIMKKGESVIIASKVVLKRNGKVLAVRKDDGSPKWNMDASVHTKSKTGHE